LGQLNLNWVQQITFGCALSIFGGSTNYMPFPTHLLLQDFIQQLQLLLHLPILPLIQRRRREINARLHQQLVARRAARPNNVSLPQAQLRVEWNTQVTGLAEAGGARQRWVIAIKKKSITNYITNYFYTK